MKRPDRLRWQFTKDLICVLDSLCISIIKHKGLVPTPATQRRVHEGSKIVVDGLWPFCFYSKTGLWPSYCQISTDLDGILHTPIVVRNTFVGRLIPRSARGRLQAKPERLGLCFCNTCNAPQVIQRRRIAAISAANRQSGGEDECYREKFRNFVAWAAPDPITAFFAILWYSSSSTMLCTAYSKQFYPKLMVQMESRDSEDVPFASLESLLHVRVTFLLASRFSQWFSVFAY